MPTFTTTAATTEKPQQSKVGLANQAIHREKPPLAYPTLPPPLPINANYRSLESHAHAPYVSCPAHKLGETLISANKGDNSERSRRREIEGEAKPSIHHRLPPRPLPSVVTPRSRFHVDLVPYIPAYAHALGEMPHSPIKGDTCGGGEGWGFS
jgi:hypothetical protein